MKNSIFTTLFIALITLSVQAQDAARQNITSPGLITSFDLNNNSVKGHPYLEKEFMPAKVTVNDNTKIYSVRYNVHSDVMEIKTPEGEVEGMNKSLLNVVITFNKDSKSYRAHNYINAEEGDWGRSYFVVATDLNDKYPLLVKERKIFQEKRASERGYDSPKPPQYKRQSDVYFTLDNKGTAIPLPKKKKEFGKVYPEHSDEIMAFIKSNKIKTSREEDLKELFNYINTL